MCVCTFMCMCVVRVCRECVCGVCAESVLCVVVYCCVLVCNVVCVVCVVSVVYVVCCVSLCGVECCVWCAVCGVWCVWRGLARAKPPVCTSPCVGSKRLRVYGQNARMFLAFCLSFSVCLCLSLSPCSVVCRCSRGVVGGRGVCLCVAARWKTWKKPCVDSKTPPRVHSRRPPPCMPATRAHVFQHVRVVPVHTGTFCTYTRVVLNGHTGGRKLSSVLLTKICPRMVITCCRGSPKNLLDLSHFQVFENRTRATRSRFLHSFAVPDQAVQFQLSWGTLRRESVVTWFDLSFSTKSSFTNDLHNGFMFLQTSPFNIYIFKYVSSWIVTDATTFVMELCEHKQATAQAHVQPHCVWLNFEHTKNSNRSKKNLRSDKNRFRIC